MTETLKINYTKRATRKTGENFDTQEIGGEWEFSIPDGADVDNEFGKGFLVLKSSVDNHFVELGAEVSNVPQNAKPVENLKDSLKRQSRELQQRVFAKEEDDGSPAASSEYKTFEPGSTKSDIVEGQAVLLENVRVWEVKEDQTRKGKRYGYVRVGGREAPVPGNYATIKSYEPGLINKMLALGEGNHINAFGRYESWMGRESVEGEPETYMWDFVPERIEKV